jgi:hypothetical protein
MLRLFFSDMGTPEQRLRNLRAMRDTHQRTLAQLELLQGDEADHDIPPGPSLTLELGLGLHRWIVDWCDATERRLIEEGHTDAD